MTFDLTPYDIAVCLAVGLTVGAVYFGGLLWTIERLKSSVSPAKTLFFSWLIRTAFLGIAFFGVMQNDWRRLLIAFGALLAVKVTMTVVIKQKLKRVKEKS